MELRIAESFTDSLGRLTGEEQKAVKMTAFDLQMNIASPGLSFHKLDKARDKNFWSLRVNSDIRIIVHKSAKGILLCYVDHHDKAYDWAERRKIEVHPNTGAAQLVEIRETIQEILVPKYIEVEKQKPLIFAKVADKDLLNVGVPFEWLEDVRKANEDSLFSLADYLPKEAVEALLDLATGGAPRKQTSVYAEADPFDHPDALRRFRVMGSAEELQTALDSPWDKWLVFLHPDQEKMAYQKVSGPARVSGPAGTGKTIVALHRAVALAKRYTSAKILVATFADTLVSSLKARVEKLVEAMPEVKDQIHVSTLDDFLRSLKSEIAADLTVIDETELRLMFEAELRIDSKSKLKSAFVFDEFCAIIDVWQLRSFDEYEKAPRLGRKGRISAQQKREIWSICESVVQFLKRENKITLAGLYNLAIVNSKSLYEKVFTHFIVDEAQDLNIPQIRFLSEFGPRTPESLFFAGDTQQRIFQTAFSWKKLGVDLRGRSKSLSVNYRTSHQIRSFADKLIDRNETDEEGEKLPREKSVSLFNGPKPTLKKCETIEEEQIFASQWIRERISEGLREEEIAVFVRSEAQKSRALAALELSARNCVSEHEKNVLKKVSLLPMHDAKGLEFRAVLIMACDDDVLPLQSRIESATDESDLEEVYRTERHLLYVALTRARDQLAVAWIGAGSEFLADVN